MHWRLPARSRPSGPWWVSWISFPSVFYPGDPALSFSQTLRCGSCALLVLGTLLIGNVSPVLGQHSLLLVNDETRVREISWNFVDTETFDTDRLEDQMAVEAPGPFYRLKKWFRWVPRVSPGTYPFDPITLQKDVVRLRRFYQKNGFLQPSIDYPASQYDSTSNSIHIIFSVREGPPLKVQETEFARADTRQPAQTLFEDDGRAQDWQTFQRETALQPGERYTEVKRIRIEDAVTTWLRNEGYAFAEVRAETRIDSTANRASVQFLLDPGASAVFGEIQIDGIQSINPKVVRRELPFQEGDRFDASKVTQGQRELFGLNLFRVALADIPSQPRDSSVTVRYRVREAKLRTLSGQVGYGGRPGVFGEGLWTHRNFFGAGRSVSIGVIAESGWPLQDPLNLFGSRTANVDPQRRFRLSTTLRQPYVFTTRLSGSVEPFFQERLSDKLDPAPDRWLSLNEQQYGLNTRLTYEIIPFRTVNLQHTFTRTRQFAAFDSSATSGGQQLDVGESDLFDKSIVSIDATLGRTDDFINPTRGFLIRPSAELGGTLLGSDVQFGRVGLELTGYLPLGDQVELAARLFGGRLWPIGTSLDALALSDDPSQRDLEQNFIFQNRFSDFFLYGGGSSDVRGWAADLAGGKVVRFSSLSGNYVYEAIGAESKLGATFELRLPFPGLGDSFRTAVFVDAVQLSAGSLDLTPTVGAADVVTRVDGTSVVSTDPDQVLIGTGGGIRYKTPAGFIRLDLAFKLTPDELDLRRPQKVGDLADVRPSELANDDPSDDLPQPALRADERFIRRFRLHFGIGRTF